MANPFTPEQISQILEEFFKVVGTRQYIGARYVPIFGRKDEESIEWDNSAPYEPLTIVLYQGNSFTSRQFVPQGVEITNTDYWALTGNYNAQVEQYRRDVEHYESVVNEYRDEIIQYKDESKFATPEAYGASADGSDDTQAFVDLFNDGKICVLSSGKTYGISQLEITGDIYIYGNSAILKNLTENSMLKTTGNIFIYDATIENPKIYNYTTDTPLYGTLECNDVTINNVIFTEINKAGIHALGSCFAENCVFQAPSFDIRHIYDGSLNNQIFGIYITQTEKTKFISVRNCNFYSLIEGCYIGTYLDSSKFTVNISGCIFNLCADHGVYLNSIEDRCTSVIENNYCIDTGGSFAVIGNNHKIIGNTCMGHYNGNRETFGFALRDCSNVVFKDNVYISGSYDSTNAGGVSCLITSLLSDSVQENITIENNVFDFADTKEDGIWLRIGYGKNAQIKHLIIKNNKITLRHKMSGIVANVACDLTLENNDINYSGYFLTLADSVKMINNRVSSDDAYQFQLETNGVYMDNVFDCPNVYPLRNVGAPYTIINNRDVNGKIFTTLPATGDNIKHLCFEEGTIEAAGVNYTLRSVNVSTQFNNTLIITKENGEPVNYTVAAKTNGTFQLVLPQAGTYKYRLF